MLGGRLRAAVSMPHAAKPWRGLAGGTYLLTRPCSPRSHVWMWHAMMGFWAGVAPPSDGGPQRYAAQVLLGRG